MKIHRPGEDVIVTLQEITHHADPDCAIIGPGVCPGFGFRKEGFHVVGPRLFLNHDQGPEFAKMMGIAQGVSDTFDLETRGPVIVHDKPRDPGQKIASAGRDAEVAQERRADHMQPPCFASHAKAGLIQMLDRRLRPARLFTYSLREGVKAIGCAPDKPGQGGWNG